MFWHRVVVLLYSNVQPLTLVYVSLSYDGHVIPLPEWFRHEQNCTVTRFNMLENFASYINQKGEKCSVILKELNNIQYYKLQGRTKFSSILIRFALMVRYSSFQTKTSSERTTTAFIEFLEKFNIWWSWFAESCQIASGKTDSVQWSCFSHWWNVFTNICTISKWWFRGTRWRRVFVQRNCSFHDCLLEKVYPNSDTLPPKTNITGEWLKCEINKCILDLAEVGFKVRAVITDDHPSCECVLHSCTKYSMLTAKRSSSTPHMLILQQKRIYFSM